MQGCAVCRERVEEARQIAARARAILATAVPAVAAATAVPPFEEILHRAGPARQRGSPSAFRWLAWAATVVVAGGLGWYARGELVTSPGRPMVVTAERTAGADSARPAEEAGPTIVAEAEPVGGRGVGTAGVDAPTAPAEARGARPEAESGEARQPQEAAAANQVADARREVAGESKGVAPAAPAPAPAMARPLAPARSDEAERMALRRSAVTEVDQAPTAGVVSARDREGSRALDRHRVVVTGEEAARALGGSLAALDGLPIEAYYRLAAEPGVIQTEQRLPGGGTLELEQWRAGTARPTTPEPASVARKASPLADSPAVAAESLRVGDLRIVARAPIPADSLRALVRRIRR
jgi:hypothetical protein